MALAMLLSALSGFTIVIARTMNARLAKSVGLLQGTFFNYLSGLLVCIACLLISGEVATLLPLVKEGATPFAFLGGAIGVASVTACNVLVRRVSSFSLTVLLFVGQVLAGVVIDIILTGEFSLGNLVGGLTVTLGLVVYTLAGRDEMPQEEKQPRASRGGDAAT